MKTKLIIPLVLTATAILMSGCVSEATHILSGPKFPPTQPETVETLIQKPSKQYVVIGLVESRGMGFTTEAKDLELSMRALKREAACIGADAVIIESSTQDIAGMNQYGTDTERRLKGIAIKYK